MAEAGGAAFLEVEGLTCGYGEAVVLSDVAFTMAPGRSLALLGRNGTGKTTLLDTLVGVTRRHAGRIVLGGREIHALPVHQRAAAGIGWVPLRPSSASERPGAIVKATSLSTTASP